ncbi:MAG: biotin/lipoyl-binding protein [bacterium]
MNTSLIHQPKKVIAISLVIALVIGIFAYVRINRAPAYTFVTATSGKISGTEGGTARQTNFGLGFLSGGRIQTVAVKTGDTVTAGQVLATLDAGNAVGVLAQAKAALASAQANYEKVINGATSPAIDVAKAAVNTAQVNFDQTSKQQDILVSNAYKNLLNSTVEAVPETNGNTDSNIPTISGSYTLGKEGIITIDTYFTGDGGYFNASGVVNASGIVSRTVAEPIGDSGLFVKFPSSLGSTTSWTISLPNTKAVNYLSNFNAYQNALQSKSQMVASAQATLDQAKASLAALVATARPEDVAAAKAQVDTAQGAVTIAHAAYGNTIITAPSTGTVTSVAITVGQIATPNIPVIQMVGTSITKDVAVMIPNTALYTRDGVSYVHKKSGSGVVEVPVGTGVTDGTHTEITSGLTVSDAVVIQ